MQISTAARYLRGVFIRAMENRCNMQSRGSSDGMTTPIYHGLLYPRRLRDDTGPGDGERRESGGHFPSHSPLCQLITGRGGGASIFEEPLVSDAQRVDSFFRGVHFKMKMTAEIDVTGRGKRRAEGEARREKGHGAFSPFGP